MGRHRRRTARSTHGRRSLGSTMKARLVSGKRHGHRHRRPAASAVRQPRLPARCRRGCTWRCARCTRGCQTRTRRSAGRWLRTCDCSRNGRAIVGLRQRRWRARNVGVGPIRGEAGRGAVTKRGMMKRTMMGACERRARGQKGGRHLARGEGATFSPSLGGAFGTQRCLAAHRAAARGGRGGRRGS